MNPGSKGVTQEADRSNNEARIYSNVDTTTIISQVMRATSRVRQGKEESKEGVQVD